MKKIVMMVCASLVAMASNNIVAQQLPNVGFNDWEGAGVSLHTMSSQRTTQRPADEPVGWNGTNIQLVGSKREGLLEKGTEGDNTFVKVTNRKVGCTASVQPWNGLISLGEIWCSFYYFDLAIKYDIPDTPEGKAANKFAQTGTYGGMDFTFRPDGIKGKFKKSEDGGSAENFHIVAYTWTGTNYGNVPGDISAKKCWKFLEAFILRPN